MPQGHMCARQWAARRGVVLVRTSKVVHEEGLAHLEDTLEVTEEEVSPSSSNDREKRKRPLRLGESATREATAEEIREFQEAPTPTATPRLGERPLSSEDMVVDVKILLVRLRVTLPLPVPSRTLICIPPL